MALSLMGKTISHYRIIAKLGEGGMGAVYRAQDLTLGREVALKFLPSGMAADDQARKRLLKEAQAASRLALQAVERQVRLHPDDVRAMYLGSLALCSLGDRERSLEWAARALAMELDESSVLYNIACTYAQLGEKDRAIACLDKALHQGFGHKEWILNDPDFHSLRDHPRFQILLQQLSAK
jgi:serine/threonine protein kinase